MIRCWPKVAKLYESHDICENRVTFVNVKAKYNIDDDLIVNYGLQQEFKSSTRDWVGIFPRNWSNLQQYLTFEYTVSLPSNAKSSLNKTITFPRIFHREASLHLEYQFVYVSREIQIMAISTYFRFVPSPQNNDIQRCSSSSNHNAYPSIEIASNTKIGHDGPVIALLSDNDPLPMAKEENLPSLEIYEQPNIVHGSRQTCQYCHRKICGSKIDALRGDFLAAFSDSLLNRVRRLERDLSLAESNLKNAKESRENVSKRLRAYEAFVAEMLSSVEARGIVQITDDKGNEILLQRVNENDSSVVKNTRTNESLENEIAELKNLLDKHQRTIKNLIEQRNFYIPRRENIKFIDREIQTVVASSQEFDAFTKIENHETIETKLDRRNEKISPKITKEKNDENLNLDSNIPNREDTTVPQKSSGEEKKISSKSGTGPRLLKISNPSGILVQGKNVKFAIVRL